MSSAKPNLVDQLCSVVLCTPNELYLKLLEPHIRAQAVAFLKMANLQTTHLRFKKNVKFAGLTYTGARQLPAFRGFLQITVAQYYYAKHKIILTNMDHPCVIYVQPTSNGGHFEYFPLEVLRAVTAEEWAAEEA